MLIERLVNKAIPAPGTMVSAQRGAEARSSVVVMQSRENQTQQQHLCRLHHHVRNKTHLDFLPPCVCVCGSFIGFYAHVGILILERRVENNFIAKMFRSGKENSLNIALVISKNKWKNAVKARRRRA